MKTSKKILCLCFIGVLLVTIPIFTDATTSSSTGAVEIKANIPPDFSYPLLIQLIHENDTISYITLPSNDGYQLTEELPSGKYIVIIGGGYDENGSFALPPDYVITHSTILVVVGNKTNLLEFYVNYKGDNGDNKEINNTEDIIEQVNVDQNEGDTAQETEEVLQNTSGANQVNEGNQANESVEKAENTARPDFGREFLERNFFSIILLIVLCVVSLVIKAKNDLLR